LGVGGLVVGVWATPPNPQSPIPNPQSPYSLMALKEYKNKSKNNVK